MAASIVLDMFAVQVTDEKRKQATRCNKRYTLLPIELTVGCAIWMAAKTTVVPLV